MVEDDLREQSDLDADSDAGEEFCVDLNMDDDLPEKTVDPEVVADTDAVIDFKDAADLNAAVDPEVPAGPEEVADPKQMVDSVVVAELEEAIDPRVAADPEETVDSGATVDPEVVAAPVEAIDPEDAAGLNAAVDPEAAAGPEEVADPKDVVDPVVVTELSPDVTGNDDSVVQEVESPIPPRRVQFTENPVASIRCYVPDADSAASTSIRWHVLCIRDAFLRQGSLPPREELKKLTDAYYGLSASSTSISEAAVTFFKPIIPNVHRKLVLGALADDSSTSVNIWSHPQVLCAFDDLEDSLFDLDNASSEDVTKCVERVWSCVLDLVESILDALFLRAEVVATAKRKRPESSLGEKLVVRPPKRRRMETVQVRELELQDPGQEEAPSVVEDDLREQSDLDADSDAGEELYVDLNMDDDLPEKTVDPEVVADTDTVIDFKDAADLNAAVDPEVVADPEVADPDDVDNDDDVLLGLRCVDDADVDDDVLLGLRYVDDADDDNDVLLGLRYVDDADDPEEAFFDLGPDPGEAYFVDPDPDAREELDVDLDADADLGEELDVVPHPHLGDDVDLDGPEPNAGAEFDIDPDPDPEENVHLGPYIVGNDVVEEGVEIAAPQHPLRRSSRLVSLPRVDYKESVTRGRSPLRRSPRLAKLPRVNYKQ